MILKRLAKRITRRAVRRAAKAYIAAECVYLDDDFADLQDFDPTFEPAPPSHAQLEDDILDWDTGYENWLEARAEEEYFAALQRRMGAGERVELEEYMSFYTDRDFTPVG